ALGADYPCERLHVASPRPAVSYILNAGTAHGRFDRVTIAEAVRPYVQRVELFVSPGASVEPYLRGDRTLGIVLLTPPDLQTAVDLLPRMPELITVKLSILS